jgi:mono/diheme cytochrome c family protein
MHLLKYIAALFLLAPLSWGNDAASPPPATHPKPPRQAAVEKNWGLLEQYCSECHNATDWAGGVAFDTLQPDGIATDAEVWEEAIRKLRGRMMPPPGKPRPDAATLDSFAASLENYLDAHAAQQPNPGTVSLHRLNRAEYANAIEDILGLKIDPAALLPRDDKSHGFDNVAEVLKVSPSFLEQYISAARQLTVQAVGTPSVRLQSKIYPGTPQAGQYMHLEGLPLGTRGGMLIEHYFPADGEYEFNINGLVGAGYVWGVMDPNTLIVTIDDVKVFEQKLGGDADLTTVDLKQAMGVAQINNRFKNIRRTVKAGPHRIGVTFLAKTAAESNEILNSFVPVTGMGTAVDGNSGGPRIANVEIRGPLQVAGQVMSVGETPSRKKIFTCRPASPAEEQPCAEKILSEVARKAFRRPVEANELVGVMKFYKEGRQHSGFETGIQKGLLAILASPKFLYRAHDMTESAPPGTTDRLSDRELASRLSFFLWSAPPDEQLLQLAEQGKLREPQVLEQQVRRMLADSRAHSLVTNFAFQWLNVHGLTLVDTDKNLFPEYTPDLIPAFETELELFIESIFDADRSVLALLTADHTFVNERLALHYGMKNVRGGQFRQVQLKESYRRGLLGKGAFLMTTSYANRTTPVLRGAYILEKFLGTPPAAPPPNVEAFPETQEGGVALSVRARLEEHRKNPSCNSCHGVIDPLGLALENFNAIGQWQWKDRDAGTPIDASGQLVDGTPLHGPDDLRAALIARPDQFVQTFTENLMTFALGRSVKYYDMPTVRSIVKNASRQDYRFSSIVLGIVNSNAFQMSQVPAPSTDSKTEVANVPH